jgi:hypothetical protein
MKVSGWTDAQESARVERTRALELLKSNARLGKVQTLEQAQVWRLAYLSQGVPYSQPCCGVPPADCLTVPAACLQQHQADHDSERPASFCSY